MKDKILEGAHSLFIQYGVRSVSMDDVARALSMSKKTLYQHFSNKDDLVTEAVRLHMEREAREFDDIHDEADNAIEELFLLSRCMREHLMNLNPSLLYDLQKYHANAWELFQQFKKQYLMGQIRRNLERGIAEGFFRSEINAKVLAIYRVESVQLVFNDQLFPRPEFDFANVQLQVFDHFVHGLLSDKGRALYQQHLEMNLKNHSN